MSIVITLTDLPFILCISLSEADIAMVAVIGLVAGLLGGMLGVGGSVIMIPAMAALLGPDQHVYQAAAMIANVAVSIPAARRHYRAGALMPCALRWILPAAFLCIFLGVFLSTLPVFAGDEGAQRLQQVFALFLIYVIVVNIRRLFMPPTKPIESPNEARINPPRGITVGAIMGTIAGFLGIGGGAIAVPLQQVLLKLPLRNCIANSATVICVTAGFGALYKNLSLPETTMQWDALTLAVTLAPTCVLGGYFGGMLTHKLPIKAVRTAFILLMIVAAAKMSGII